MQEVLTVSFCDRPGCNTKSILLQSAITICWLKQMAAINDTPGPDLMAPEEMFYVKRILQTVCSLSVSFHMCLSILSLFLNFASQSQSYSFICSEYTHTVVLQYM